MYDILWVICKLFSDFQTSKNIKFETITFLGSKKFTISAAISKKVDIGIYISLILKLNHIFDKWVSFYNFIYIL